MTRWWRACRQLDRRAWVRAFVGIWIGSLAVAWWSNSAPPVRAAQATTTTASRTVWDGVYTEAQAERGKASYNKDCAFCHLEDLTGQGFAPALIEDTFKHRWEDGTVAELFSVVKATMPQDKPESLTVQQYADIVAYVLQVNKYPSGKTELPPDPAALKDVSFKKK